MADVQGEYLGHEAERGFTYRYHCPRCRRPFLETAPALSGPTLCHRCLTGGQGKRVRAQRRLPKGRRGLP